MPVFNIKRAGKWEQVRAESMTALNNWAKVNGVTDWNMNGMMSRGEMEAAKELPKVDEIDQESPAKYVIRCRDCGIIVTTEPQKHDTVWKRDFTPETSPIDKETLGEIEAGYQSIKTNLPVKGDRFTYFIDQKLLYVFDGHKTSEGQLRFDVFYIGAPRTEFVKKSYLHEETFHEFLNEVN